MIPRYSRPEMTAIWDDEFKYHTWLSVEVAVVQAWADAGAIPRADADLIAQHARVNIEDINRYIAETHHDVTAFMRSVADSLGPESRWVHLGLTSSDVWDTATNLQMMAAADLLLGQLATLRETVGRQALRHKDTICVGRTHGVHAEPMTFGLKLALWYDQLGRDIGRMTHARAAIAVGQISGAVGTFAHLDPAIEADVCARLGLVPAPISTQVIQRDRHAELFSALAIAGASLETFALEIRGLQKTEIGEVEEPFAKGQKGSSAMPHKRNPIGCEQIVGLARLLRGNATAAFENVALWHERDISHSSVERVILPDSFIALDHMLRRFTRIVSGMVVYADRMRDNLERSRGVVFSGQILLELARRDISREQAYEWVQRNAMRSFHERTDFRSLLLADADVMRVLGAAEIEKAFDLDEQLRNVDAIFARVFAAPAA
jgi:adenylosuccinate lyase